MHVSHIIAGLEREVGGPAYSVPMLCKGLVRVGVHVQLHSVRGTPARRIFDGVFEQVHEPSGGILGRMFAASSELNKALERDLRGGALLHTHGLWLAPNIYPAHLKRKFGGRIVHSTRGMLAPVAMRISKWKKIPVWLFLQRYCLAYADCLHATAASERDELRGLGLRNPIAVIPNGIDVPDSIPLEIQGISRTVLYLGRIHPKKGLDRLVRAWASLGSEVGDWQLRIVGPAEVGHDDELRKLGCALSAAQLSIEPPVYGLEKDKLLASAGFFVLPTLNENFGVAVAEALAYGVPVISTKGAPWAGLEVEKCGWWIDHGVEPLASALRQAMGVEAPLRMAMGERARAWMKRDFSWDMIAKNMKDVYGWLREGGDPPACVDRVGS